MSNKIIKIIQGLLAKASGTENEAEAAAFAAKAAELLQKHNLDEAQVLASGKVGDAPVEETRVERYHKAWELSLASQVAELYFCSVYAYKFVYRGKRQSYLLNGCSYVGKEHNRAIAMSVAEYLMKTVKVMSAAHGGDQMSYARGLNARLQQRIRAMIPKPQETGEKSGLPALYDMEKKLVDEFLSKVGLEDGRKMRDVKDKSSFMAGVRDADRVAINQQVDVAGGPLMLGSR